MFDLRFYIYAALLSGILLYGIWNRYHLEAAYRLLLYMIGICLSMELGTRLLPYYIKDATFLYHIYVIMEYIFIAQLYYRIVLKKYAWARWWTWGSSVGFAVLSILNTYLFQNVDMLPTNAILLSSVLYLFMGLFSLVAMVRFPEQSRLYREPAFWFNMGTLSFYLLTFFVFGFFNRMQEFQLHNTVIYDILYVANIGMYISYAVAIIMDVRVVSHKSLPWG